MKKLIVQITLSLFVFATGTSAQITMPQSGIPAAGINSKVGVAAGVKGSVQLARDGGVGQVVSSGAEIFLGDKISTDAKGGLQILLLDQTTFTIGANSSIVVDQFVYDPATDAGKVSVRVVEGTFRFITGKIAHKNPENMQVDLPNGTIGVRGTMVMGNVNGTRSLAILTGPGDKNNTGSRHGAIIVGGKGGDESKSVRIAKTGFGTEIAGDGAPKMPFLVPQVLLDAMTSELSPKSGDDSGGEGKEGGDSEGSASEQAGQDAVDTGGDLGVAGSLGDLGADMGDETTVAVQDQGDGIEDDVLGPISKFQELDVLSAAGIMGHYDASGDLFDSSQVDRGDFSFHMMIDFGQKKILEDAVISGFYDLDGAGASPNRNFLFDIGRSTGVSFAGSTTGDAIFSDLGKDAIGAYLPNTHGGPDVCGSCTLNTTITLLNSGFSTAKNLKVEVTILDSATPTVSGSSTSTNGY